MVPRPASTCRTGALLAVAAAAALAAGCAQPSAGPRDGRDVPEARIERRTLEDDAVRIDETRVRGQPTRLTVQPKAASAPAYEIVPPRGGQDPSQARDGAGRRVWNVLSF